MPKPILLTVDDDSDVLRAIERDLRSQYGGEYRVLGSSSPEQVAAHCTGIEATYQLRTRLGLNRQTAAVAGVGSSFSSANGIVAGPLAK